AKQGGGGFRLMAIAGGEHGWHDPRAGMDRPTSERLVNVCAMRRRTVDKGCAAGAESMRVTNGCAWPVVIATSERALNVILVAGGDAETDDVDQQVLAFSTHREGQIFGAQRNNGRSQLLGDGCFRQSSAHKALPSRRRGQPARAAELQAIGKRHDAKSDQQHEQPQYRNGGKVAAFVKVVNKHRQHLRFRGEKHYRSRQFANDSHKYKAPRGDHAGAQQWRSDLPKRAQSCRPKYT